MKSRNLVMLMALVAAPVQAAPWLVSDPWVDAQPDSCQAVEGAVTKPLALIADANGKKSVHHDLAGTPTGSHVWTITCANAWGSSVALPFSFGAGVPLAPAGLRLQP